MTSYICPITQRLSPKKSPLLPCGHLHTYRKHLLFPHRSSSPSPHHHALSPPPLIHAQQPSAPSPSTTSPTTVTISTPVTATHNANSYNAVCASITKYMPSVMCRQCLSEPGFMAIAKQPTRVEHTVAVAQRRKVEIRESLRRAWKGGGSPLIRAGM